MIKNSISEQALFLHKMGDIKKIKRYSNNKLVKNKDTVASHSWRSTLIALTLKYEFKTKKIDFDKIIEMTIIHDLVEYKSSAVKALGHRNVQVKQENEFDALETVFKEYKGRWKNKLYKLLKEFLEQKTTEAKLAKAIENYESNMHVIEEVAPVKDKKHKQLTIDYIKRRIGINKKFDEFIKYQLKEIETVGGRK